MGLKLLTPPDVEPVGLGEARPFCRLLHEAHDNLLVALIAAGRERCERIADRALITQQWKLTLPGWPCDGVIRLPRPPLQEVDSVKYVADNGTLTTLDADLYLVDATAEPGTIIPAYGEAWPAARVQTSAVEVTFWAGYGDEPGNVPAEIRQRLLNYVAYCFQRPIERDERWLDSLFEGFACGTVP